MIDWLPPPGPACTLLTLGPAAEAEAWTGARNIAQILDKSKEKYSQEKYPDVISLKVGMRGYSD